MLTRYASRPRQTLLAAFLAWKAFLLVIAIGSTVGPSYDTSTELSFALQGNGSTPPVLVTRLTRWDAIYFTQIARRGYRFEQEWAFGGGFPAVVSALGAIAHRMGFPHDGALQWALGIVVAHCSHLLAVLMLYQLTLTISKNAKLAFLASLLHVLSPAGLFLSAPCAESSFAFLSFTGYFLLAKATSHPAGSAQGGSYLIAAGATFGLATAFRSNGILNGIPFAVECALLLRSLVSGPRLTKVSALACAGLGGGLVAAGSIVPQMIAYWRYCSDASETSEVRSWCAKTVPSIYSFVQAHYWNTGFLAYWTISNVPLFLLASPMLTILFKSGLDAIRRPAALGVPRGNNRRLGMLVWSMAAAQLVLAGLTFTSYHVQIVSRLSSGYPVWYWWTASCLSDKKRQTWGRNTVMFMVMYAGIQGALYASFLPPA